MTAAQADLLQHPLSKAFPSMSDDDLDALAEDIKKHGQREVGLLLDGMVLDGWHRYLACTRIGLEFYAEPFTGEDPRAYVLSKNLLRRHLTALQRAAAIVAVSNWRETGVTDQALAGRAATVAALSDADMAKQAEVGARTIRSAKQAERIGLGDQARAGKVTARQIAETASLPKKKRAAAVKAIKAGETPPAPKKPRVVVASAELEKTYQKCKEELIEVQGKYADLAETAAELADKLEMYEAKEPDEQQKVIAALQKKNRRLEQEVERITVARNDCQAKNNELIREVKRLKRKAGE